MPRHLPGMALLSAATLLFQVALTRIFSIAQFYHFAFLVISLALLGFGASGTLLTLKPRLQRRALLPWYALSFAVTVILTYLLVNHLPFDSYTLATDRLQVMLLIMNLLALAIPFVFAGALIGTLLSLDSSHAGRIYGANMIGSAVGAIIAPLIINLVGSERTLLVSALWGAVAGWGLVAGSNRLHLLAGGVVISILGLLLTFPPIFEVQPSPYKTLRHYRLNPNATIVKTMQSAASRLDIVQSSTIHSAQGLSIGYLGQIPPQMGLILDGDNLLAVANTQEAAPQLAEAMPSALAYAMRSDADALLLGSGGNMEAWIALANDASAVTVIEPDRLVYNALTDDLRDWGGLAEDTRLQLQQEEIRTFTQRTAEQFDVVILPLTDNYRPITAGAFSLSENYTLTVEAFQHYLDLARDDGLFVVTRWLQTPPSESLRTLSLILAALDTETPLVHIVAFRSFQTITFIVKPTPLSAEEVTTSLRKIEDLQYDLVLAPDIPDHLINQHARLPEPIYHDVLLALATSTDRPAYTTEYPFDVSPPTDDRPFFYHFFRWDQTSEVLANLGRRWQPFGGSGYFVLVALLAFALGSTVVFVLLPVGLKRRFRQALLEVGVITSTRMLLYFALLGLAFLMVEISLIQQFILILGQPTITMAMIIGTLLLCSGLGSMASSRIPWRLAIVLLAGLLMIFPWLVEPMTPFLLELPQILRFVVAMLLIAPVGFLMGVPFPLGIAALSQHTELVPWAWATNGSASVVSGILAVMLALSFGLNWVLLLGGGLYLLAAVLRPNLHPA